MKLRLQSVKEIKLNIVLFLLYAIMLNLYGILYFFIIYLSVFRVAHKDALTCFFIPNLFIFFNPHFWQLSHLQLIDL